MDGQFLVLQNGGYLASYLTFTAVQSLTIHEMNGIFSGFRTSIIYIMVIKILTRYKIETPKCTSFCNTFYSAPKKNPPTINITCHKRRMIALLCLVIVSQKSSGSGAAATAAAPFNKRSIPLTRWHNTT